MIGKPSHLSSCRSWGHPRKPRLRAEICRRSFQISRRRNRWRCSLIEERFIKVKQWDVLDQDASTMNDCRRKEKSNVTNFVVVIQGFAHLCSFCMEFEGPLRRCMQAIGVSWGWMWSMCVRRGLVRYLVCSRSSMLESQRILRVISLFSKLLFSFDNRGTRSRNIVARSPWNGWFQKKL